MFVHYFVYLGIDFVNCMVYNIDSERDSEHPMTNGSLMCDYDKPIGSKTGDGTHPK